MEASVAKLTTSLEVWVSFPLLRPFVEFSVREVCGINSIWRRNTADFTNRRSYLDVARLGPRGSEFERAC